MGTNCRSAIATLVERTSCFVVMVPLPDGHKAPGVQTAIVAASCSSAGRGRQNPHVGPRHRACPAPSDRRSVGDQHLLLRAAQPLATRHQREHHRAVIRQYFPKSTDLNNHSADRVAEVAQELTN